MQPAVQQAQPEALPMQPPASARYVPGAKPPPAQRASCCRWAASVAAALVLAGLSAAVLLVGSEHAFLGPAPVGLDSPADILRNQFQTYHAKTPRFALHMSVGRVYLSEGRLGDATVHAGEALEFLAETDAQRVEARQLLALARQRQGRLSEARELLKVAVPIVDEDTEVGVLHALAGVRAEMGHLEAALKLYNRAFDLAGQDADMAAVLAADIADAWASKGRLQESVEWLRTSEQVLDACRGSPAGADEALVAKVNARVGDVRHRLGSFSSAMESYRRALRTQERLLHPSHPDLVSTRLGVARAQRDLGDAAAALGDLEAVELALRSGPQEGLELSRVLIVKSDILREAKRVVEAEHAIQEAIRLQAAALQGEEHPEAALGLACHGSILHDAGNANEAHEKYAKALEISVSTVGESHPATAAAHNSLGTLFEDLGDDDSAHEHFSKCLQIQLETLGKDSPDVANTYNNLATVLFRRGEGPEAANLLELALQVLDQAAVPRDNPERALYQENLQLILSKP